jgi:hypothetical protein
MRFVWLFLLKPRKIDVGYSLFANQSESVPFSTEKENEPPLIQTKENEPPLIQTKENEPPLIQTKENEPPLIQIKEMHSYLKFKQRRLPLFQNRVELSQSPLE